MSEQEQFRGQVIFQRYPKEGGLPEVKADMEDEDTCIFRILVVQPLTPGAKSIAVKCNSFPAWSPDDVFEFYGETEDGGKFGPTFVADQWVRVLPDNVRGIQKYLENHVKGVGKKTSAMLVDHFGVETIEILDKSPERLAECPGLSHALAKKITEAWQEKHDPTLRQLEIWLAQHEIGPTWAKKFLFAFGRTAIQILEENPYRAMKVAGVGFRKADDMARRMSWPECCPERTEAAVVFVIDTMTDRGHTWVAEDDLVKTVRKVASSRKGTEDENKQLPKKDAMEAIALCVERRQLVREPVAWPNTEQGRKSFVLYYPPALHAAEVRLAQRIGEMQSYPHVAPRGVQDTLARVEESAGIQLSEKQKSAVIAALENNLSVMTGGPGSGKTTTLNQLLQTAVRIGLDVRLCAPTGRAAKRMSEVTGREASTIHKLLEYDAKKGEFRRDADNPIDCSLLVIDEASMLDIELADSLMDAVPDSCSVLFVGDIDQLPSVGPGMVLRDLIECQQIHVTRLDKIFRQQAGSLIIDNAYRIRSGEMPIFPDVSKGRGVEADSYFMEVPVDPEGKDDAEWIKKRLPAVIDRLVTKFSIDPIRDIQVLAPMRVGAAGCVKFNEVLQTALNGEAEAHVIKGQTFRKGDRVMQLANNYDLEIWNGDIGFVKGWNDDARVLTVDIDGRDVEIPYKESRDLTLAYASTVHKAQGAEYAAVIVPLISAHWNMLERHLLYTVNTRARKIVVFMASWRAIEKAVKTDEATKRNTFLGFRIVKEVRAAQLPKAA